MIDKNDKSQVLSFLFDEFLGSSDFPAKPSHKVGNPKKKAARKAQKKARKINRSGNDS
jgi:hypothetical protein